MGILAATLVAILAILHTFDRSTIADHPHCGWAVTALKAGEAVLLGEFDTAAREEVRNIPARGPHAARSLSRLPSATC